MACVASPPSTTDTATAGPSIPTGRLYGRAPGAEYCPSAEEDGSVPLPPEQRGYISRRLADDEGDDGRWMDVPRPEEVWGGAVGLTLAMVECLILPLPGQAPPGSDAQAAAKGQSGGEPEGTELEEKKPYVRIVTADDDGGAATATGGAARPDAARAKRSTDNTTGDGADDDGYEPDCVTVPPDPSCVPGGPLDSGVKTRATGAKMRYFREPPENDGALPTPEEWLNDVTTFTQQAATCMCVVLT